MSKIRDGLQSHTQGVTLGTTVWSTVRWSCEAASLGLPWDAGIYSWVLPFLDAICPHVFWFLYFSFDVPSPHLDNFSIMPYFAWASGKGFWEWHGVYILLDSNNLFSDLCFLLLFENRVLVQDNCNTFVPSNKILTHLVKKAFLLWSLILNISFSLSVQQEPKHTCKNILWLIL
jgi:hypothetical protein